MRLIRDFASFCTKGQIILVVVWPLELFLMTGFQLLEQLEQLCSALFFLYMESFVDR